MVSKDVEEKTVMTEKDEKMLELMGGRAKEGRTPTDDGKNDSIFDF